MILPKNAPYRLATNNLRIIFVRKEYTLEVQKLGRRKDIYK